jgi:branched-chain amino acid transport system ATP-binding protein
LGLRGRRERSLGGYVRRDKEIETDRQRVYSMFPILHEKRRLLAGGLSGGRQQMLAIRRALMGKPKLLLLDEPSLGLSPLLVDQILSAIAALRADGVTVLLVEQNAAAALEIPDRGYVIETGRFAFSDKASALLSESEGQECVFGIRVACHLEFGVMLQPHARPDAAESVRRRTAR